MVTNTYLPSNLCDSSDSNDSSDSSDSCDGSDNSDRVTVVTKKLVHKINFFYES